MALLADKQLRRLTLQIERDLVAQSRLRLLLTAAADALRDHRHTLRNLTARIRRAERAHRPGIRPRILTPKYGTA